MIKSVKKRDGKVVSFDKSRIETAIRSAMARTDEGIDWSASKPITLYAGWAPQ